MSVGDAAGLEFPMWHSAPRSLVWLMGMFEIVCLLFHQTDSFCSRFRPVPAFPAIIAPPCSFQEVQALDSPPQINILVLDSKSEPLILTFWPEKDDLGANKTAEVTQVRRVSSSTAVVAIIPVRDILQAGYNAKTDLFAFKTHWAPVIITIVTRELEP